MILLQKGVLHASELPHLVLHGLVLQLQVLNEDAVFPVLSLVCPLDLLMLFRLLLHGPLEVRDDLLELITFLTLSSHLGLRPLEVLLKFGALLRKGLSFHSYIGKLSELLSERRGLSLLVKQLLL